MTTKLTLADYQIAAKRLKTGVAEVWAVTKVESGGAGFDSHGRCIIRFEPHIFSRYTKGAFNKTNPAISFSTRKLGYPKSIDQSWQLFREAAALKPNAAVLACSWGMFQVMAFNYSACGCESLSQFVERMERSEGDQLDMFCTLLINWNLDKALRNHQFDVFANFYNGPGYKTNRYDTKMALFCSTYDSTTIPV